MDQNETGQFHHIILQNRTSTCTLFSEIWHLIIFQHSKIVYRHFTHSGKTKQECTIDFCCGWTLHIWWTYTDTVFCVTSMHEAYAKWSHKFLYSSVYQDVYFPWSSSHKKFLVTKNTEYIQWHAHVVPFSKVMWPNQSVPLWFVSKNNDHHNSRPLKNPETGALVDPFPARFLGVTRNSYITLVLVLG